MSDWWASDPVAGKVEWWNADPVAPAAPGVAEDVAKSTAIAVPQTAIGFAGLPGLARQGVAAASDYIASKLGASPETLAKVQATREGMPLDVAKLAQPPAAIQGAVEQATGPFYAPKTEPGKLANVLTQFGLSGGRAGLVPRLASGAGFEASRVAAEGTPYELPVAIGGALAVPAGLAGLRRAVTPLPMQAARAGAVDTLRAEGVPLSAGAITGSKPLQYFEQALGDIPGAGRAASAATERTAEGFTSAALRRAGENAPRATPEVIDRAFTRIGNRFDQLEARNTLHPDQRFGADMRTAINDYNAIVAPPNRAPIIADFENEIANLLARNNQTIPGEAFQSISSRMAARARGAPPEVADTLRDMRTALHDAMERTMLRAGSPDLGAFREVRNQYRNMLTLERAATGAGENAALGLISPSALRNATVAMSRRAYARGTGDFADLARSGEAVLKPLPNSGTPGRTYAQHLPTAIGALLGGLAAGVPGAALGASAAIAGPPVLGRLLHSRLAQAYLRNQTLAGPRVRALPNLALPLAIAGSEPRQR